MKGLLSTGPTPSSLITSSADKPYFAAIDDYLECKLTDKMYIILHISETTLSREIPDVRICKSSPTHYGHNEHFKYIEPNIHSSDLPYCLIICPQFRAPSF